MDNCIFTLVTAEEDGCTQRAEEVIKELGDSIVDYQKSKTFSVQGFSVSVFILVCTKETFTKLTSSLNTETRITYL